MAAKHREQLPLAARLEDEANFGNFVCAPENTQLVNCLREAAPQNSPLLIWGPPASGRTHLLQACCHRAGEGGAIFLPLGQKRHLRPEMLEGIGGLALICLDDLQCAAGGRDWERALMRLINAVDPACTRLVMAASAKAADIEWELADLRSRLQQALAFRLHPLNEDGIRQAFALRAHNRGLRLAADVASFICDRAPRRLDKLMAILEHLDHGSMQRQRRITIPLAKEILGWGSRPQGVVAAKPPDEGDQGTENHQA